MPDGYSRWREDFAAKEPKVIETGVFFRRCPACSAELEIKLSPEKDDITISYTHPTKREEKNQWSGGVRDGVVFVESERAPVLDRKCAYCFRNAIRGGVLCQSHSFCRGCEKPFPDGKPFELKEFPMCKPCSGLNI